MNHERSLNLTRRIYGINTTTNPSWRMRRTNFSGILRYNGTPNLGQTTRFSDSKKKKKKKKEKRKRKKKKSEKQPNSGHYSSGRSQSKNKKKPKNKNEKRYKCLGLAKELKKKTHGK